MEIYKTVLYWGFTTGVGYLVSASLTDKNPRDDQIATIWLIVFAVALAVYLAYRNHIIEKKRDTFQKKHDSLIDESLKVLLRQKLVSEHDRLVMVGSVNDTQCRAWMDSYKAYEELCNATDDNNGVIDKYKHEVLDLPNEALLKKKAKIQEKKTTRQKEK